MTKPSASLIVVSRNRDSDLCNLIEILKSQHKIVFELVIVTNTDRSVVEKALGDFSAKYINCDIANISVMRNLGVQNSAADFVAFCDDDAIPEPDWLFRLIAGFNSGDIASTTGPVLGRSGFAVQSGPVWTDHDGIDVSHEKSALQDMVYAPQADHFVRVQGTNCAFRKSDLLDVGGFDEGLAYFLDETEMGLRLAKAGKATGFVRQAVVQHMSSANETRDTRRAPKSMKVIAASIRHFAAKHSTQPSRAVDRHIKTQLHRLHRGLIAGILEPRDVRHLESELRSAAPAPQVHYGDEPVSAQIGKGNFVKTAQEKPGILIVARQGTMQAAVDQARTYLGDGHIVTILELGFGWRRHVRFARHGTYFQKGGRFGRQDRKKLRLNLNTRQAAREAEAALSVSRSLIRREFL